MRTIIAPASAAVKSGVIVVRASGPNSFELLEKLSGKSTPSPRHAVLRNLFDAKGDLIDNALVIAFNAPNSFTGENVVEFHLHGGMAILKNFLDTALETGLCYPANPGEFSRQAFENSRMDLTEAEAIADLIDAETNAQLKQAQKQMRGELGALAREWREEIISALSESEAYIDFPDEDLPEGLSARATSTVKNLIKSLKQHIEDSKSAQRIRDGFSIIILGEPNAGKSSLLNALARRQAAIVSSIAGTTRDVVEISLNIGGNLVFVADTAGLRETSDEIEEQGVKIALERAEHSDLRIGLASDAASAKEIASHLAAGDILVWSKSDLQSPDYLKIDGIDEIAISTKNNSGINELEDLILMKINTGLAPVSAPLTRARHVFAVSEAIKALEAALDAPSEALELACEDLRIAARALGEITGEVGVDDILDKIFSSFCIGK